MVTSPDLYAIKGHNLGHLQGDISLSSGDLRSRWLENHLLHPGRRRGAGRYWSAPESKKHILGIDMSFTLPWSNIVGWKTLSNKWHVHPGNLPWHYILMDTNHLKMYFLWNMGIFQPAMLVYQRGTSKAMLGGVSTIFLCSPQNFWKNPSNLPCAYLSDETTNYIDVMWSPNCGNVKMANQK